MYTSKKTWLIFLGVCLITLSCKKEDPIDLEEEDPIVNEPNYTIGGTSWTSILPDFFADERILAMEAYGSKVVITYLDIYSVSGVYDGSTFTEHGQVLGSGSGMENIEIVDGKLYGLGWFGSAGGFYYDSTLVYDPWNGAFFMGTSALTAQKYNGNMVVGCGIDPYIRENVSGWVEVGEGVDGAVYSVINFDGKLIAGGDFAQSGTTSVNNIAQWDGTAWSALGQGLDGTVNDLVVFGNKLIAIGSFTKSGDGNTACRYVAAWDGTNWQPLGTGLTGGDYTGALIGKVYHDQLIIGGKFDGAGAVNSSNIIKWDGTQWVSLAGGVPDKIEELCIYKNKLYIANGVNISDSYFLMRLD